MDIYVNEIKLESNRLKCYSEEETKGMKPTTNMIVDSDNLSFIYLLDDGENYYRLHFVEETWSMLNQYFDQEIIVNDHIHLDDFWPELEYLIENIEGNNNYGQEFESKVTSTFNRPAE